LVPSVRQRAIPRASAGGPLPQASPFFLPSFLPNHWHYATIHRWPLPPGEPRQGAVPLQSPRHPALRRRARRPPQPHTAVAERHVARRRPVASAGAPARMRPRERRPGCPQRTVRSAGALLRVVRQHWHVCFPSPSPYARCASANLPSCLEPQTQISPHRLSR
jgi:hypothetical protein